MALRDVIDLTSDNDEDERPMIKCSSCTSNSSTSKPKVRLASSKPDLNLYSLTKAPGSANNRPKAHAVARKRSAQQAFGRHDGLSDLLRLAEAETIAKPTQPSRGEVSKKSAVSTTPGRTSIGSLLSGHASSSGSDTFTSDDFATRKPKLSPSATPPADKPHEDGIGDLLYTGNSKVTDRPRSGSRVAQVPASTEVSSTRLAANTNALKGVTSSEQQTPDQHVSAAPLGRSGPAQFAAARREVNVHPSLDLDLSHGVSELKKGSKADRLPRNSGRKQDSFIERGTGITRTALKPSVSVIDRAAEAGVDAPKNDNDNGMNNAYDKVSASGRKASNLVHSSSSLSLDQSPYTTKPEKRMTTVLAAFSVNQVEEHRRQSSTTKQYEAFIPTKRSPTESQPGRASHVALSSFDFGPAEGLGTSPRLIRLKSKTPPDSSKTSPPASPSHSRLQARREFRMPSPLEGALPNSMERSPLLKSPMVAQSPKSEIASAQPHSRLVDIEMGDEDRVLPSIEASIEVAAPASSVATTSKPMTKTAQPSVLQHLSHLTAKSNTTNCFHTSNLASRLGQQWTQAEIHLSTYLHENVGQPWHVIDKRMGRGYNSCATKYCIKKTGLKQPENKMRSRHAERRRAIDAMVNTMDLDLETIVTYLQRFIDTETLPQQAVAEYKRLLELEPDEEPFTAVIPVAVPAPVSILQDKLIVSGSSTPVSDGSTIASTRKRRRGVIDDRNILPDGPRRRAAAQLTEGQYDLQAMDRRLHEQSLDSVLASDCDETQRKVKPAETEVPCSMRLFNPEHYILEKYDEEDLEGWFVQRKKPYLSNNERAFLAKAVHDEAKDAEEWKDITIHVDFDQSEYNAMRKAINLVITSDDRNTKSERALCQQLSSATRGQLAVIVAFADKDERLQARTRSSIKSWLEDFISGLPSSQVHKMSIQHSGAPSKSESPASSLRSLLHRECGTSSLRRKPRQHIKEDIYASVAVTKSFTGASGDVGNISWSPDGIRFAAAGACLVDPNSMQYNQPNNLLFGDIERSTLYELPAHHRMRTKAEYGANSTHSMHVSQDPRLFETVPRADFSRDGRLLFSVGYDHQLQVHEIDGNGGRPRHHGSSSWYHATEIDLMSMNRHHDMLATGAQNLRGSIKVLSYATCQGAVNLQSSASFESNLALNMPDRRIFPSALEWGVHSSVSKYLLAGFASTDSSPASQAHGEVCLWDIHSQTPVQVLPRAGNVFDCRWNTSSPLFATACTAGLNANRGNKSVVRLYNPLQDAGGLRWTSRGLEMECPALDINDVLFNPYNDCEIIAGATDGCIYVWDFRRPDHVLHRLQHGIPLMELDPHLPSEAVDTGVRFCAWAEDRGKLFTGSSDGALKVWDTRKSTQDTHIRDVATFNSGIMSGAFTEDFSKLLIGEVNGSIDLLEVGEATRTPADVEKFSLQPFEVADLAFTSTGLADAEDSGVTAARELVRTGKISIRPMGGYPKVQAVQGPNYDGPFDANQAADALRYKASAFQERMTLPWGHRSCQLEACKEVGRHFRSEADEVDDSERSMDRIPQAMRDVLDGQRAARKKTSKVPSMSLTCAHCGAPARVRSNDMAQAAFPLCERCSFGCLRCGTAIKLSFKLDIITCSVCGGAWDINVLGYLPHRTATPGKTKSTSAEVNEERECIPLSDDDGSTILEGPLRPGGMGDMLDLVQEYHHSLWGKI